MSRYTYNVDTVNPFDGFSASDDSGSEGGGAARIAKKPAPKAVVTTTAGDIINNNQSRPSAHASKGPFGGDNATATRGPRRTEAGASPGGPPFGGRGGRGGFRGGAAGPRREPRPEKRQEDVEGDDEDPKAVRRALVARRLRASGDHEPQREFDSKHREFDRRSGTGRGREVKKDGGGAHNWGKNDENEAAAEGEKTAWVVEETVEGSPSAAEPAAAPAVPAVPEGPVEKSFSAHKAELAAKRATLPQLKGVDQKEFHLDEVARQLESSGFVAYTKPTERVVASHEDIAAHEETKQVAAAAPGGKKTIHLAEVAGARYFGDRPRRGGGERGGRGGGGRGGGGRGGFRGGERGGDRERAGDRERGGDRDRATGDAESPAPAAVETESPAGEARAAVSSPNHRRKNLNLADDQAFPSL